MKPSANPIESNHNTQKKIIAKDGVFFLTDDLFLRLQVSELAQGHFSTRTCRRCS